MRHLAHGMGSSQGRSPLLQLGPAFRYLARRSGPEPLRKARLGDLGPPVGPEPVERVVDDHPDMAVRVGEEPVGAAQRGGSGLLDHHPTGPDSCFERGDDRVVAGHVDGQDGLGGRLARQCGGHLLAAELGEQVVGADQQENAGVLNSDMAAVGAGDSSQPSPT
jgi:hypothetical protein